MKKYPVLWCLALLWLAPSLVGSFTLWYMPDSILRAGDAGVFISATAAPGGILSQSLTNVQTSLGTLVVDGSISVRRGQPLKVVDSTKNGLQLCASANGHCVALAGDYVGALIQTRESGLRLSHDAWIAWSTIATLWFFIGAIFFALSCAFSADEGKRRDSDEQLDEV